MNLTTKWILGFVFILFGTEFALCQFAIHTSDGDKIEFEQEICSREIRSTFGFTKFHTAEAFFNQNGTLELIVRFKGVSDGHILLTQSSTTIEPLYLIILGSYNNRFSEIRRTTQAKPVLKLNTPGILSGQQWRTFIIRYHPATGSIFVFPAGSEVALLSWQDESPLQIRFFSFSSYNGRILEVAYNCKVKGRLSSRPNPNIFGSDFDSTDCEFYDSICI